MSPPFCLKKLSADILPQSITHDDTSGIPPDTGNPGGLIDTDDQFLLAVSIEISDQQAADHPLDLTSFPILQHAVAAPAQ